MKKLNPITNELYKSGDVREDGKVFVRYKDNIKRDGFNAMVFCKPESVWRNRVRNKKNYSSVSPRVLVLLRHCKGRSEKNGLDFNLTQEWLEEKFKKNVCELSGEKFNLGKKTFTTHYDPYSPSIDRIDASKGYTQDNCRLILTSLNLAMNQWGFEFYIKIAKKVLEKNNITHG